MVYERVKRLRSQKPGKLPGGYETLKRAQAVVLGGP